LDFGVDGAGVAVGVLSDSFDALGGAAADRASGDLPAVTVLRDASGTDEGRAMAQIVHDVAPGADLLFHTASGGQAAFAQGILNLVAAGADVIVDDIVYLGEPFFQDGLVARAVDAAAAAGVAYFSSAGNAARDSYEAAFAGSGQDLALLGSAGFIDFGELHDFDDGAGVDVRQRVSIPRGGDIFLSFQWDEPFASVSENGRGSASDYDILLFGADGDLVTSNLFAISAGFNIGADPVEAFRFVNRTATTEFDIVITHFSGPEAGVLKYIELGDATIVEHDTNSSASFGHAPAEGGMGVGAAFWGLTPSNGVEVPVLESFSSAGPATILFDDAGVRLAEAERRASPDVVGPDGTNNTFFGRDIGFDADTSPNFFGTSAAAPHVAAVAALLLEANPNLTPQAI
ncbi:MAG: S8 family serine peptidase, partial [Alphaproteobacteria bacterium]